MELAAKYGEDNIVAYCDDIIIAKPVPATLARQRTPTGVDTAGFKQEDKEFVRDLLARYGLTLNMDKTKIYNGVQTNVFEFAGIKMCQSKRLNQAEEVTAQMKRNCEFLASLNIRQQSKLTLYRKSLQHQILFYQMVDNSKPEDWKQLDEVVTKFLRRIMDDEKIPEEMFYLPWEVGGLDLIKPSQQKEGIIKWFQECTSGEQSGRQIQSKAKTHLRSVVNKIRETDANAVVNRRIGEVQDDQIKNRYCNFAHMYFLN